MDRIWLKSYPEGVPAEIDWKGYQSLGDLFDKACAQYRDRPAFHNMGKTITFGELDRLSRDFAAWLQLKGLAKGARVAIMMPNCLQYPVALYGTLRAGSTVVNANSSTSSRIPAPRPSSSSRTSRTRSSRRSSASRSGTWWWRRSATCSASRATS